jgi:hypothetical protein
MFDQRPPEQSVPIQSSAHPRHRDHGFVPIGDIRLTQSVIGHIARILLNLNRCVFDGRHVLRDIEAAIAREVRFRCGLPTRDEDQ